MHRRLTLGLAIGAAMLLMSCSGAPIGSDDSTPDSVTPDSTQSAITQPATAWLGTNPPGTTLPDTTAAKCDRIGSRAIKEFVAAFNDGGIDLNPYFASGEEFQWYSDEQRLGVRPFVALYDPWNRSTLIAYLNEARRTRGPMTIRRLKFNYFRQVDQSTGYGMELDWDGHRRLGKASVHCGLGQINVWSLGSTNP